MVTQKLKDYVLGFLIIMTIVLSVQTLTGTLEIRDLELQAQDLQVDHSQIIQSQLDNRQIIVDNILNVTKACLSSSPPMI